MTIDKSNYQTLYKELVGLIESTKTKVISQANSAMTVLFWHIGKKILKNELHSQRADYGKQIVVTLSRELTKNFGRSYEEKNLRRENYIKL